MTGKGFRPRTIDLGRWRYLTAAIFLVYFILIVLLPFLVLLWSSLQKFYSVPSLGGAPAALTLDPYRAVLDYPRFAQHGMEQPPARARQRHRRHAGDGGDLLDRREDQSAGTLAARQPRVAADGVSRASCSASRS